MKKYIGYIGFIIVMLFVLKVDNVYAYRYLDITIDANGTVTTSNQNITNESEWYKYENDTLYLYTPITGRNAVYSDWYRNVSINKNTKIVASEEVHIENLTSTADITIENNNTDYTFTVDRFTGNDLNKLTINNSNINDRYTKVSQIRNFKNVEVNNSFISQNIDPSDAIVFVNYLVGEFTNIGEAHTGLVANNSKMQFSQVNLRGDGISLDDSELIVSNNGIRTDGAINIVDSYVQGGIFNVDGKINNIENSEIRAGQALSFNNYEEGYKTTIKDSIITASTMQGGKKEITNSKIYTNCFRAGSVVAKDTEIYYGDSWTSLYYFVLTDSKLVPKDNIGSSTTYFYIYNDNPTEENYSGATFVLDNSTFEIPHDIGTYNAYIKDSTLKAKNFYGDECNMDSCKSAYEISDIKFINSTVDIKDTYIEGGLTIDNSKVNAGAIILGDPYDEESTTGKFNIYESELNMETDEEVGITFDELDFRKSNIIISALNQAWVSKDTIERFNIIGINRNKKIMDYKTRLYYNPYEPINTKIQPNTSYYDPETDIYHFYYSRDGQMYEARWNESIQEYTTLLPGSTTESRVLSGVSKLNTFIDDGEISPFAEIKTPLKITFKIINGKWADGTTEDKEVGTYWHGAISEDDIPVGMIANDGYTSGSWDKEISYDDVTDEAIYTYTFRKLGEVKGVEENPKTGMTNYSLIVLILLVISIVMYNASRNKTVFYKE